MISKSVNFRTGLTIGAVLLIGLALWRRREKR